MPYLVQTAFDQFYAAINLPGDHRTTANDRRDRIVTRLRNKFVLVDAFATGSIPRMTALQGHADVDVMVVLHHGNHIAGRAPANVLRSVRDALGTSAGSVRRNGQAVTLKFAEWPNVDVVPCSVTYSDAAAKTVNHYSIPDMNRDAWIRTKPRLHTNNINNFVNANGPNVRKTIKMVKHWNQRVGSPLQSFHIEVIALKVFTSWGEITWDVSQWFDRAAQLVANPLYHDGAYVDEYLDWSARPKALALVNEARSNANSAWYATYNGRNDHKAAIASWRKVFGNTFPTYG